MEANKIKEIVASTVAKLKSSKEMTLDGARALSRAVMEKAKEMGVKAVVCISDGAGNPKLVECADDAYLASYDVAVNKAYTVVALKMSTSKLGMLAKPGGELYGIQFTNGGKIVIFGGGEPLCGEGGKIIGGLGVSGGSAAQDTALAEYGKRYFENNFTV